MDETDEQEEQAVQDTDERRTKDSKVEDLRQLDTVVVGALDDLRHDLQVDRTQSALDDLRARLDYKFQRLGRITEPEPETIYEMRYVQGLLVDNMNKLAED